MIATRRVSRLLLLPAALFALTLALFAADINGTTGNDNLFFVGTQQTVSTTLTNPYSLSQIAVSGEYNVNSATYEGFAGLDTIFMTNVADLLLPEVNGAPSLGSVERLIAGDGRDVLDIASNTFVLGNTQLEGGAGDDLLWGNSGDDTLNGSNGNDIIDGGPGNDTLNGQNDDDLLFGGAGNDTISGLAGINQLFGGPGSDLLQTTTGSVDFAAGGGGFDTLTVPQSGNTISKVGANEFRIVKAGVSDVHVVDVERLSVGPVDLLPFDASGPITSALAALPAPVPANQALQLEARIDDSATGGTPIASAWYEVWDLAGNLVASGEGSNATCPSASRPCPLDALGNPDQAMAFDAIVEDVQVTIPDGTLAPGLYTACIRGTDANGASVVGAFACSYVAVHSASGHVATGGGQISNNAAFCTLNGLCASSESVARFAFASKYTDGGTVPAGPAAFAFAAGNLDFRSTAIDTLEVAGAQAQYEGSGTINRLGDYGFRLTVADSAVSGGPATDTVRIEIWDKTSSAVIYDNGAGQTVQAGDVTIVTLNSAPAASDDSLGVTEDEAATGTLHASDEDSATLTFSIVANGTNGTALITDMATGAYTYTPNANATGSDSFTFKVNDGGLDSNVATISVTIDPVNDAPVATDDNLGVTEDLAAAGTLSATDGDSGSLTFSIVTNGTKGTALITNTATGAYTYTPNANATGSDSFTFTVNDGTVASNTATINVTIDPVNDAPEATDGVLTADEDTAVGSTLGATDGDSASLTFSIVANGTKGRARVTNASTGVFTYVPFRNANGGDSFTFQASDGTSTSNVATIAVSITPVNDEPVAHSQTVYALEDADTPITLAGSDAEGSALTYTVTGQPTHGTLSGAAPAIVYTPAADYNGPDSVKFLANDGSLDSAESTILITVSSAVWRRVGPEGGSVTAVAGNPLVPSIVYAGTDGGGVFKSLDGGASWSASSAGLTGLMRITSLAVDPVTPSTLYAATDREGVFKSTDGGASWTSRNTGISYLSVQAITIDPSAPSTVYVGTAGAGFFKSLNGGMSWTAINVGLTNGSIYDVAVDPLSPTTLYAATYGDGVVKSTNGGALWTSVNTGLPTQYVNKIAIDPLTPGTLYTSMDMYGVYKSTTGGANWTAVNTGLGTGFPPFVYASDIAVDPFTPGVAYLSTSGSVFKTTNGGASWAASSTGLVTTGVNTVAPDSAAPGVIYVGATAGIFKSVSAGSTWTGSTAGLTAVGLSDLAVDPAVPAPLYALQSNLNGGVYKTSGSGTPLTKVSSSGFSGYLRTIAAAPTVPISLYVGESNRVYKSTDSASSWTSASTGSSGSDVYAIAVDPLTPATLYAGIRDGGLVKSTNSGTSWIPSGTGLTDGTVRAIAIDPVTPTTLYAANGYAGLFKSTNGGASWSPSNTGLTYLYLYTIAINPVTPTTLYVGGSGVFKSTNGGASWAPVSTGLQGVVTEIAIDPAVPTTLYAASSTDGIFRSTNGGASWSALTVGLSGSYMTALAIDPLTTTRVYSANFGGAYELEHVANDPPVSSDQQIATAEDVGVAIALVASDPDADPLTYTIVVAPAHGTLSGTAPNLTYTPAANYNGPDSFTFTVNDGTVASNTATINVTIDPVNDAPVATGASITGTLKVGEVLTGHYTYADVEDDAEGTSTFRWRRNGSVISGATSITYTLVAADSGKSIAFEVTPVAAAGTSPGAAATSTGVTILNSAPTATSVSISGTPKVGQLLTGNYTYGDVDGDAQGTSTFRWLRNGGTIGGATGSTYTPLAADSGQSITFEVRPVAATGTSPGTVAISSGVTILNSAPTATSVNIAGAPNVGQLLTGQYAYGDLDGDAQGTSTFRWLRNGGAIVGATATTYSLVAADAGQSITFEVTPVAATGTSPGTAVTSSGVTIQGTNLLSFLGLFDPWGPPAPGTYNGTVYSKGKTFELGKKLDVKWGYGTGGVLVNSSRASTVDYPVVTVYGPLASCGSVNGAGSTTPVNIAGIAEATTYDKAKKVWKKSLTLKAPFIADRCYVIKVDDRVTGITSVLFPFKTKK